MNPAGPTKEFRDSYALGFEIWLTDRLGAEAIRIPYVPVTVLVDENRMVQGIWKGALSDVDMDAIIGAAARFATSDGAVTGNDGTPTR